MGQTPNYGGTREATSTPTAVKLQANSRLPSPPAERVAVSEGAGRKQPVLFLQHPNDVLVSILLKKIKLTALKHSSKLTSVS